MALRAISHIDWTRQLQRKRKQDKRILPFFKQYHPSVPSLKQILMQNWHLIQQQPLLRRTLKNVPIFSYKRGRSLNKEVTQFIKQANSHHLTIKFMGEGSDMETTFLDKNIYKGERFAQQSRLDIKTHLKAAKRFQYTHFSSCHPLVVKKGFSEVFRLLARNQLLWNSYFTS